jgi:1-acyl-sn-glycerol-3-phosphate acyltransferase
VLKRELLLIPVFGWALAMLKPIIINRGEKFKALKKVIKQGADGKTYNIE